MTSQPHPQPRFPDLSYVLPVKLILAATRDGELASYLSWLSRHVHVIVADGSAADVYHHNAHAWPGAVVHAPVRSFTLNGKVAGVCDGVQVAQTRRVVIADDDVRYDAAALARIRALLDEHDAVIPQNYFRPAPWHARWDTGRTLLNRVFGGDYAGTIAVNRESFMSTGGYCGAVLFENLELMRTLRASGFDVHVAPDLYVARQPPPVRQFLNQRVRQAYDSRAQPLRLALELSVLPGLISLRRSPSQLAAVAVAVTVLADVGRRSDGGGDVWPIQSTGWAVPWLLERAVTSWLAMVAWFLGGVTYRGIRLQVAAHDGAAVAGGSCPRATCLCRLALRGANDRWRDMEMP